MRIWNANAKCEYNMEDLLIKHITHHPRDANYEDDVLHSLATIKKNKCIKRFHATPDIKSIQLVTPDDRWHA